MTAAAKLCGAAAIAIPIALSSSAGAQPVSEAERLFQQGRAAARVGDHVAACAALRRSLELEVAPGTHLAVADCEEKMNHLIEASAHYEASAAGFKAGDERQTYARGRVEAIALRLPRLTVRVDGAGAPFVTVSIDGERVEAFDSKSTGRGRSVNPGDHVVTLQSSSDGATLRVQTIAVEEGERREVVFTATDAPKPAPRPPEAPSKTAAYAALGTGAAAFVVGSIAGVLAIRDVSTMDDNCAGSHCNATGLDAASSGRLWSTVSTIGFGAAIVATGVGIYLLARPSAGRAAAWSPGVRF